MNNNICICYVAISDAYVMLLLAMISLHMLTFRMIITMVAEFCSLVILIHNTLLEEIMIMNYKENYTSIPQYVMTCKDSISLILWLLSYTSSRIIIIIR